ncbi:MAG: hypothetical protein BAJALOKI3v1_50107 [Promethearchaeota archaeon]|nr:MAG: hypothetical protein BAJALOKI3v1_50107 [Candidatus Lokiarchaeota archaeon]
MKLNLQCGEDLRNGYKNINFGPIQGSNNHPGIDFIVGDFRNLSSVISDDSCEEINFVPVFNIVNPNEVIHVLRHWRDKLSNRGVLKIHMVDIRLLSGLIYDGDIELNQIHKLIFGSQQPHQNVMDLKNIKQALESNGYQIESINIANDFMLRIECYAIKE